MVTATWNRACGQVWFKIIPECNLLEWMNPGHAYEGPEVQLEQEAKGMDVRLRCMGWAEKRPRHPRVAQRPRCRVSGGMRTR